MTVLRSRLAVLGIALLLTLGHRLEAGFSGTDVFIPAVARSGGAGGSQFFSTLWITNLGGATANIQLDFLKQGQANPTPVTRTDTLVPGATRRYDNVVEQLFGVSGAGGAVRVRANQEVFVSSRTYDRPSGAELKDVKGLFFSGIPTSFAIGLGEVSRLQGVSNGPLESYRYNFGLVETTGQAVSVVVRLRNEGGTVTNTQQYDLGAYEARQVNAFAGFSPAVSTIDALLEAQSVGGAGKVLFYGTQIAGTGENPGSNDSAGFEMSFKNSLLAAGGVPSVNGITGAVTIAGSGGTTVTTNGGTITVASVGASGGVALPYSGSAGTSGAAFAITNSSTGIGLQANSTNQPALYGVSVNSRGVYGVGGAYGVYGQGNEGVHGQGDAIGVYAQANTDNGGYGVLSAGDYGVYTTGTQYGIWAISGEYAVFAKGNFGGAGAKYFVEPHPTDPEKEIRFVCLEGPESGTYFRGSARTVNGFATIEVPDSFRMVTDEKNLTVVATPRGDLAMIACVKTSLDGIVIQSSKDVDFDYVVNGVRKAFKDHEAISENKDFVPRSATDPHFTTGLPAESIRRLKANGILNEDGSIRMETAERLGWTRVWTERERAAAVRTPER
jgi:hypothetical protein